MACATSSAVTSLPIGCRASSAARSAAGSSAASSSRATQGVSAVPGATPLTRIPSATWSAAIAKRQCVQRALAGAVHGAARQARPRCDRTRDDDRRRRRPAQRRECRPHRPGDADHVDVQHPVPLVVAVVGDRALRSDSGVGDDDVESSVTVADRLHGGTHGCVVGDVAGDVAERPVGRVVDDIVGRGSDVEQLDAGAAGSEQPRHRQSDPGRAAGDGRDEAVEVARLRRS